MIVFKPILPMRSNGFIMVSEDSDTPTATSDWKRLNDIYKKKQDDAHALEKGARAEDEEDLSSTNHKRQKTMQ